MATYTSNYGLHQWAPEDNFLRTDFNTDLQKIDTALGQKAEQSAVTSLQSAVSGKAEFVLGSYTGNDASNRAIALGFQPKLVLISGGIYNGMVDRSGSGLVQVTSSGFTVSHSSGDGYNTPNVSSRRYCYAALR